jgi:RNA polymerase sigma-32 factor
MRYESQAESHMHNLNGNARWHGQWRTACTPRAADGRVGETPEASGILDADTEIDLIMRWREHRDQEAGNRLIRCYQRLIRKIARRYRDFDVAVPDLIAEGNVGLVQAIERFDPARGFRLSTYAVWWIRAAISEAVLNAPMVKAATSEESRRLYFNLNRAKNKLGEPRNGDLTPASVAVIARDLAVSESEVVRMNRWMSGRDVSLNTPVRLNDHSSGGEYQDFLCDMDQDHEERIISDDERRKQAALVREVLNTLSERERHILTERWLRDDPRTLAELGGEYGLTRERVRQIEARALAKVRKKARKSAMTLGMIATDGGGWGEPA